MPKLLPLSILWRGVMSSEEANRVRTSYTVPIGWRGLLRLVYASWINAPFDPNLFFLGTELITQVFRAPNGISLDSVTTTTGEPVAFTYAYGFVYSLTFSGRLYRSVNGYSWELVATLPQNTEWTSIAFDGERFVAVRSVNTATQNIYVSTDGISWSAVNSGASQPLWCVIAALVNNSNLKWFVACGDAGVVRTSYNGVNWDVADIFNPAINLRSICFGLGWYTAVGGDSGTGDAVIYFNNDPGSAGWGESSRVVGGLSYYGVCTFAAPSAPVAIIACGEAGLVSTSFDALNYSDTHITAVTLKAIAASSHMVQVVGVSGFRAYRLSPLSAWTILPATPSVDFRSIYAPPLVSPLVQSRRPYYQLKTSAGQRQEFQDSAAMTSHLSPGEFNPDSLVDTLEEFNVDRAFVIDWLVQGGETLEMSLDYQRNNFVGDVEFNVHLLFGPVDSL